MSGWLCGGYKEEEYTSKSARYGRCHVVNKTESVLYINIINHHRARNGLPCVQKPVSGAPEA